MEQVRLEVMSLKQGPRTPRASSTAGRSSSNSLRPSRIPSTSSTWERILRGAGAAVQGESPEDEWDEVPSAVGIGAGGGRGPARPAAPAGHTAALMQQMIQLVHAVRGRTDDDGGSDKDYTTKGLQGIHKIHRKVQDYPERIRRD